MATAVQQEEDIPVTIAVPMLEGSQAPDPSDSLAHQTGTPPVPVAPFLDIPFVGTPPVGCPFFGIQGWPLTGKVGLLPQWHLQ